MRFSHVLSLLPLVAQSVFASPILPDTSLTREYKRLVTADICATVNVVVPIAEKTCVLRATGQPVSPIGLIDLTGTTYRCTATGNTIDILLAPNVCLCLDGGLLTTASIANLALQVGTSSQAVLALTLPYGLNPAPFFTDVPSLLLSLRPTLEANIGDRTTSCVYPPEGTPASCADCSFTCPTGFKPCGTACIALADSCISGVNFRRRDQLTMSPHDRCPGQLSACGIPSAQYFNGRNFECIDTTSDLESCGACAFPLPGEPIGQDCTAIPHALSVDCILGSCVVKSCERGFDVRDGNTTCVPLTIEEKVANWKKAKDSVAKRQVNAEKLRSRIYKATIKQ